MRTGAFWGAVVERALKTAAQALVAVGATNTVFDVTHLDWGKALAVAGSAAVLSVATSLASAPIGNAGPSVAGETVSGAQ